MERVWIGVGSNLLDPKKQVDRAIWALANKIPKTKLVFCSKYYCSLPLGRINQPNFLNMVVVLDTDLNPEILLIYMQKIEKEQGRVRSTCFCHFWQPRTLDLDILLFGKHVIRTTDLIIPHYNMIEREFFIYPLFEIDQCLIFPDGIRIIDIIKKLPKNGLTFWKS
ncbi:2-amino-4-hydroxy-6-hydroxymethyldihydropteridine pyrophosphokinase [Candidatus Blochmanniella vafra str. BVAF]|uniref:2-amino-4-hydroxy-6-hydroxymethyldihydropteridine pyrophosphokinase n=1 Tax=Blochmanniella vafra (strain BVAF) TaxID=859654 RepID=E8Q5R1_BLOVB|nr:2-amino-4-hydroxy-6-hydroxymethyldihydropteridine diphosphokinase [Candidatus Blochmannia vafer]ADV33558.1 2-amino-4-hydroxy-6-hydroxymethyldihydropteridine pyrophosphokinase [Candidatus Blochmannia vafer str. BVAF]